MPYRYVLTATVPASPEEIYEAWLDSHGHSEMTGAEAIMSDQVGGEISAWDGYISGRNLELVPGRRIVQSWRTSEFSAAHGDSVVTVTLESVDDGTLLTLEHSNVPDEQRSYEEGGWQSNYFEPMVAYFTERGRRSAPASPKKTVAKIVKKAKGAKRAKPGRRTPLSRRNARSGRRAKATARKGVSRRARKSAGAKQKKK